MFKKAILGTLLVVVIGALVAGAIIRTVDKTENVAEARGLGQGRGAAQEAGLGEQVANRNMDADTLGSGRGGYGQGAGTAGRQYANYEEAPEEWVLYEGTVAQAPADGVDLIIETYEGETVVVGTGPGYMEDQGFALQLGEQVQVRGYWEDDEFKAAQVTRLQDGQTITLRDQGGRPAWAGSGKGAIERQAVADPSSQGQAQGRGGSYGAQGSDQPSYGGEELEISAGAGDLSEWEVEALQMALDDEYKAWSVYDQVIADFGAVRPFTSIQRAEENHIASLVNLFNYYGMDVPQNAWPGNVPAFDTLAEACAAGVQAEIDNAALYGRLFDMVDNPDIVRVFTSLQQASQVKHLPAFERCAS